ncbi:MAG TPA: hypothetical protein VGY54_09255 [Polyangiaceae bacterium]|nr:hypothetical protein [Polyangiaceae bacterium]
MAPQSRLVLRLYPASSVAWLALAAGCHRDAPGTAGAFDAGAAPTASSNAGATAGGSPIPSASVEAVVNPSKLPVYSGPTGSVEGTVLVRGPPAPEIPQLDLRNCPAAIDTYGKLFRAGPARDDGLRPVADAVVVVTGYSNYIPEKRDAERVTISVNCGYPTRTIALTFGQRLEIANDSRLGFAPVLSGTVHAATLIAPPGQNGEPVKLYPPRPGHFVLLDQLQPFIRQTVVVLLQPLHTVSDLRGHYHIDGVPVGKLKVGAQLDWIRSEELKDIDVRANVVENMDFVLTYTPEASAIVSRDSGIRIIP